MKNKNKKKSLLLILLLLVVGISIGYAALATTLNINGNTTIEKASWDIHFENLLKTTGSENATVEASIDDTKTLIEYTVTLAEPGDYYEFTVDMVNNGTIDAMISEVLKEGLTTDQEKYISYTATYSDGMALEEKDYLKSGETQNIRVRVKYRDDISAAELPTENQTLSLKFMVTYIQADENAKERMVAICKRATTLHTEECTQTAASAYCSGAGYTTNGSKGTTTITYGNLGTTGTLKSGDAYDCDVNGDGTYDSATERFYYVSDLYDTTTKQFDSSYAALIYYSSTVNGQPNNISANTITYDSTSENWHGPRDAIVYLPKVTQWNNISLSNDSRAILTQNGTNSTTGGTLPSAFSYDGYAARLLTTQEVDFACGIKSGSFTNGELDGCNYLMENTKFSSSSNYSAYIWLETPTSINLNIAHTINARERYITNSSHVYYSVSAIRPVIEVPKSNILY